MHILPQDISSRSVRASTRALFTFVAAALAPLLAQYLFRGGSIQTETLALFAVGGGISALVVARTVVDGDGATETARRVFARSLLVGLLGGALTGFLWVSFERPSSQYRNVLGPLFGALYGLGMGAVFGLLFGVWARRARTALDHPSVLASHRLLMEAGALLSLTGIVGFWSYRVDALALVSVATTLLGCVLVIVGIVRSVQLQKICTSVNTSGSALTIAQRTTASFAPALVWAPVLDHMIVQTSVSAIADPSPFRTTRSLAEVCVVPSDLSVVRQAIGSAVAFGIIVVSTVAGLQAAVIVLR
jgi:hypothetical protein